MKALLLPASLLLWTTCTSASDSQLLFSGSFWDRADSFSLLFDLTGDPATAHWDGYPENDIDRKKDSEGRIRFDLELSEVETASLQNLANHFHLCHPGQRAVIGTGLSVRATLKQEESEPFSYSYFSLDLFPRLGLRGENFPLFFQSLIRDGTLTVEERIHFFEKVDSLGRVLSDYQEALDILSEHQAAKTPVPWKKVRALVERTYYPWWGIGDAEFSAALSEEATFVIDALLKPENIGTLLDPPPKKVILQLAEMSSNRDGYLDRTIPLPTTAGDRTRWALLSSDLKSVLEDFVIGPYPEKSWTQKQLDHSHFEIPIPSTDSPSPILLQRLKFVDTSGWIESHFPGGPDPSDIGFLRILALHFEEHLSKCVATIDINGKWEVILFTVENAEWKILRRIDYKDWTEYGWKEPLFK